MRLELETLFFAPFLNFDTVARLGPDLYECGEGSNNEARFHTPDQAVQCCDAVLNAYSTHARVVRISNAYGQPMGGFTHSITFVAKVRMAIHMVSDALPQ